jgi:hypothetical protein
MQVSSPLGETLGSLSQPDSIVYGSKRAAFRDVLKSRVSWQGAMPSVGVL